MLGGFIPQFATIIKDGWRVLGLSPVFVSMDLLGGIAACLSLAFTPGEIDYLAIASFAIVVACQSLIFIFWAFRRGPKHAVDVPSHARMDDEEGGGEDRGRDAILASNSPDESDGDENN
jgi:hypothetical protein